MAKARIQARDILKKTAAFCALGFSAAVGFSGRAAAAPLPPGVLGVSYPGRRGEYASAAKHLAALKSLGFSMVAFAPSYAYTGLNQIDFSVGPSSAELTAAMAGALEDGFTVMLKPHLDPPIYFPGFNPLTSHNDSWRVSVSWRGYFDVDPMSDAYREGIIHGSLLDIQAALARASARGAHPAQVQLELGTELMDSVVAHPGRWLDLLKWTRGDLKALGLVGRVRLSHDFAHHLQIPEDFVLRMSPAQRKMLGRYIAGLDAVDLSQYLDLKIGEPLAARAQRPPTPREIAKALSIYDARFRNNILGHYLGLTPAQMPPLGLGEFGVGRGGLLHPNYWSGAATPAQKKEVEREIALGLRGLADYLAMPSGRTARYAVLWVTGPYYDIFGWMDPNYADLAAQKAVTDYLRRKS
ncbi:MAG TPA: hypothetical protein VNH15_04065 [Elusimicrobiota bacterium]|nr:hypothetical protein [Elusimicrobiota bacterium]